MAEPNQQTSYDQERESLSAPYEHGPTVIQGQCHNPVNGILYAVSITFPTASPNDLATLQDELLGVSEFAGHECSISLRATSGNSAWDGHHRV